MFRQLAPETDVLSVSAPVVMALVAEAILKYLILAGVIEAELFVLPPTT